MLPVFHGSRHVSCILIFFPVLDYNLISISRIFNESTDGGTHADMLQKPYDLSYSIMVDISQRITQYSVVEDLNLLHISLSL